MHVMPYAKHWQNILKHVNNGVFYTVNHHLPSKHGIDSSFFKYKDKPVLTYGRGGQYKRK